MAPDSSEVNTRRNAGTDRDGADTKSTQGVDEQPRLGTRIRAVAGSRPFVWAILIGIGVLFWLVGLAKGAGVPHLLSLTIWGIAMGGILSLGSIGLTLTYGVLKFPNFSHGALITIGAYVAFIVIDAVPHSAPLRPL